MRLRASWLAVIPLTVLAGRVSAECCRVVRVDANSSSTNVRVCEPGPAHSCGAPLFTGSLALGQAQDICAAGGTIVYQEYDPAQGSYADPVEARCDGGDVEL